MSSRDLHHAHRSDALHRHLHDMGATQSSALGSLSFKLLLQAQDSMLGSVVLSNPEDRNQNQGEPQGGNCQQEAQSRAEMGRPVGRRRSAIMKAQLKSLIDDGLVFTSKKLHH